MWLVNHSAHRVLAMQDTNQNDATSLALYHPSEAMGGSHGLSLLASLGWIMDSNRAILF